MEDVVQCLWPKPHQILVTSHKGSFNLVAGGKLNVTVTASGVEAINVITLLECHASAFLKLGYGISFNGALFDKFIENKLTIKSSEGDDESEDSNPVVYEVKCCVNPLFFQRKVESYCLTLEDNVDILSSDLRGLNYAFHTLTQIIKYSKNGPVLPFLRIEDSPDFEDRGICISSFLNCLKPNVCNYYIEMLGILRINQLYYEIFINEKMITSTFAIENIAQIVSLQNLCKKHFVTIIPIFELDDGMFATHSIIGIIENFIFESLRYFPECRILHLGTKLSKFVIDLNDVEMKLFVNLFHGYTICVSDVQLSNVPFGFGLSSSANTKVPTQLYQKAFIESFSIGNSSNFTEMGDTKYPGFILTEADREPLFRTSVIFKLPLTVLCCGIMWNVTSQTQPKESLVNIVVNEFMKHYVLNGNKECENLGGLILEIGGIESSLQPHVLQLITSPDEVPLSNSFENLLKCSKQIRQLKQQLSACVESENGNHQLSIFAHEALFTCELLQFTLKLGSSLCQAGRNPSGDKIGCELVNLGIHNLPAIVKTDLANKLITLIEKLKSDFSSNYKDEIVSKNSALLYKLLENLIPENSESHESDYSVSFDTKSK